MNVENDATVTVSLEDLRAVLLAADYISNSSLRGPVDRLGDAVALATMRRDAQPTPLGDACCTAFPLDGVCFANSPCVLHGCDDGSTLEGCYCDPSRRPVHVISHGRNDYA
jgi:hypothetical protein